MRTTQAKLEADQRARAFDVDAARARLAALDGAEGKPAEVERKFLQRRVDKAEARARRAAELVEMGAEAVVAGIRR